MSDALRTHLEVLRLKAKHDQGTPEEWRNDVMRAFEDEGYLSGEEFYDRLIYEVKHSPAVAIAGNERFVEAAKRAAGLEGEK